MTLGGAAKGTMIAGVPTSITGGVMGNELVYVKEEGAKKLKNKEENYNKNIEEINKKLMFESKDSKGDKKLVDWREYAKKILNLWNNHEWLCPYLKQDFSDMQKVGKCVDTTIKTANQRNQAYRNIYEGGKKQIEEFEEGLKKIKENSSDKTKVEKIVQELLGKKHKIEVTYRGSTDI